MRTTDKHVGTTIHPKIKAAIEKNIPSKWVGTSEFLREAIIEKLEREGIIIEEVPK